MKTVVPRIVPIARQKAAAPQAITVNGVVITPEAVANEAQHHPMPAGKPGWAWRAAAHALVLREVLLQAARARALVAQPQELSAGRWETEEEALVRQLLEALIVPAPADEAQLRARYEQAPERFRGPSLFEAAHILFAAAPDDPAARALALEQAQAVLEKLRAKPGRFADLAAQYSACPSRENGGLLGQLASGDTVPEFEAALATMAEGSISAEPVQTRYGVHILRLDARVGGKVLPFEAVRPHLCEAHEKAQWVHAGRAVVQSLVDQASIEGIDMSDTPWTQTQAAVA